MDFARRRYIIQDLRMLVRDTERQRYTDFELDARVRRIAAEYCTGYFDHPEAARTSELLRALQEEIEREEGLVDGRAAAARERALADALAETQAKLRQAQARITELELAATGEAG